MSSLLSRLRSNGAEPLSRKGWYGAHFMHNGQPHVAFPQGSLPGAPAEHVGGSLVDRVHGARDVNAVVSAAVQARALLISQLRFQWFDEVTGRRFGSGALSPLERPGTMSRPVLLSRIEEDVCWTGNAYVRRVGNELYRLRPDWVDVVVAGSAPNAADSRVVGYQYWPGGDREGRPVAMSLDEVMHFAPEPHPLRVGVGASWVTSVMRDIVADGQASTHIENFFEKSATANMVVRPPEGTSYDQFNAWVEKFEGAHAGVANAWSNMYVMAGTDVQVVGSDLAQLDLRTLTGGFEARIAVRSRVPSVILGTREGTQGSALNAGNYAQTRRLWADGWFTPYAEMLCAAFEQIVPPPASFVELSFDRSRVLFLQEDEKDAAEIMQTQLVAYRQGVEAGGDPDTVRDAIAAGDIRKVNHTGNVSVQLQPPGSGEEGSSNAAE